MARKGKTAVLKRQRELRKAEKAAQKREQKELRSQSKGGEAKVATKDDLAGYGLASEDGDDEGDDRPPASALQRFGGNTSPMR